MFDENVSTCLLMLLEDTTGGKKDIPVCGLLEQVGKCGGGQSRGVGGGELCMHLGLNHSIYPASSPGDWCM